jgi:GMP synthase-like glutamine amidotransferase
MRTHILQHSDGTPPGAVLQWLRDKGHKHDLRRLDIGHSLPDLSETELIVILGGPMNVDDVKDHPWLRDEKLFLEGAIAAGKSCLGLCLGGQLLAQTLGAKVTKNTHWEVGWHPVQLEGGSELTVFQWHQDTFTLPNKAERIATNSITENQGFRFGRNVVGVQFHPEATTEWVVECAEEVPYPVGPHVQSGPKILEGQNFLVPMRTWFFDLLNELEKQTLTISRERESVR